MHDSLNSVSQKIDTARAFIAIPMHAFCEPIDGAIRHLQAGFFNVKWIDPRHAHITLHFFGDIPRSDIPSLAKILSPVIQKNLSITLTVDVPGFFPNPDKPRIIWLGVKGDTERIEKIQKEIVTILKTQNYPVESREFRPHITIGRASKHKPIQKNPTGKSVGSFVLVSLKPQKIDSVILYESVLSSQGPKYKPLETFPLS